MVTPGAALPEPLRDTAISCRLLAVPGAVFPRSTEERLICEQAYFDAGMAAASAPMASIEKVDCMARFCPVRRGGTVRIYGKSNLKTARTAAERR